MLKRLFLAFTVNCLFMELRAQPANNSKNDSLLQIPSNYLYKVSSSAGQTEQKLEKKTDKVLAQMMKQEQKIKKKFAKLDSLKANEIFGSVEEKYAELQDKLKNKISRKQYLPSLDTLSNSLKFLQQNPELISKVKDRDQKLQY